MLHCVSKLQCLLTKQQVCDVCSVATLSTALKIGITWLLRHRIKGHKENNFFGSFSMGYIYKDNFLIFVQEYRLFNLCWL